MADLQKISQVVTEVLYQATPVQKVSQVVAEVLLQQPGLQKISQVVVEVLYIEASSGPTQEKLLRHGTWFGSGVKQRMWWAR